MSPYSDRHFALILMHKARVPNWQRPILNFALEPLQRQTERRSYRTDARHAAGAYRRRGVPARTSISRGGNIPRFGPGKEEPTLCRHCNGSKGVEGEGLLTSAPEAPEAPEAGGVGASQTRDQEDQTGLGFTARGAGE